MHLSALDIFCAVAADGSVTQASKVLGRVPSNVTTRIQQLEQELGAALFSREGKRMTLTREGEIFLAYARRILALMAEARQAVDPGPLKGKLRIGSMESSAATRLPQLLKTFRALYPGIAVQLTMGATRDLAALVLDHALDGALVAEPAQQDGAERIDTGLDPERLDGERVFSEAIVIVLPPQHPAIAGAAALRIGTLAALEPGCTYRAMAERWGRASRSLQTREVGSYHAMLASVATGQSIGVMPQSVLDILPPQAEVKTFPIGLADTLLIRRKDDRSPALQAFLDLLKDGRPPAPAASPGA